MYHSLLELSVFSLLINASFFTQTLTSDIQADGLKGRVKTVRYQTARLSRKSGEWIEDKLKPRKLISYDEYGNMVEELIHTDIDDIMDGYTQAGTRVSYRYDKNGNRTENVLIDRGYEKEAVIYRRVFHHDQSGKRLQEFLYGRSTRLSGSISALEVYTHEYDTKGRRTATTGVISGRVLNRWEYVLDEEGNPREIRYYRENLLIRKESYEYEFDEKGNWIRKTISKWVPRKGEYQKQEVIYRTIEYY